MFLKFNLLLTLSLIQFVGVFSRYFNIIMFSENVIVLFCITVTRLQHIISFLADGNYKEINFNLLLVYAKSFNYKYGRGRLE